MNFPQYLLKKGLILYSLFFGIKLNAQDSNLGVSQNVNRIGTKTSLVYDADKAYLMNDWVIGKVYFRDKATWKTLPINYNAFNERLERLENGKPYTFDQNVGAFILGDTSLVKGHLFKNGFEPIDNQGILNFYEVLYEGKKVNFLKYAKFKSRENRNFNEANTTVSFDLYETYYVENVSKRMQKIKKNKKAILELFDDKIAEISTFIEDEGLKFKDWDDVYQVISYYDSL